MRYYIGCEYSDGTEIVDENSYNDLIQAQQAAEKIEEGVTGSAPLVILTVHCRLGNVKAWEPDES